LYPTPEDSWFAVDADSQLLPALAELLVKINIPKFFGVTELLPATVWHSSTPILDLLGSILPFILRMLDYDDDGRLRENELSTHRIVRRL
jgi:hypothetical protein